MDTQACRAPSQLHPTPNPYPLTLTLPLTPTRPAELIPNYTTIEYALPRAAAGPPVFLWVIDTCLVESELQAPK